MDIPTKFLLPPFLAIYELKALYLPCYVDKDNKNLANEHILLFFFFPHEMFIHFSAML